MRQLNSANSRHLDLPQALPTLRFAVLSIMLVRSGSIATEMGSPRDVRLYPNSGGIADIPALRVCATSGHFSAGHLTRRWHPMTVKRAIAATA